MSRMINFELVSPESKLVSEDVYMVQIPADEGQMGVLGGHAALVCSLGAGVVILHKTQGGEKRRIFISGGFADISPENCSVLAEEAIDVSHLDQSSLEQYLVDLNEDLTLMKEPADLKRVEQAILLTKAKLRAVSGVAA